MVEHGATSFLPHGTGGLHRSQRCAHVRGAFVTHTERLIAAPSVSASVAPSTAEPGTTPLPSDRADRVEEAAAAPGEAEPGFVVEPELSQLSSSQLKSVQELKASGLVGRWEESFCTRCCCRTLFGECMACIAALLMWGGFSLDSKTLALGTTLYNGTWVSPFLKSCVVVWL